jgi:hypothetical protein
VDEVYFIQYCYAKKDSIPMIIFVTRLLFYVQATVNSNKLSIKDLDSTQQMKYILFSIVMLKKDSIPMIIFVTRLLFYVQATVNSNKFS